VAPDHVCRATANRDRLGSDTSVLGITRRRTGGDSQNSERNLRGRLLSGHADGHDEENAGDMRAAVGHGSECAADPTIATPPAGAAALTADVWGNLAVMAPTKAA
jgi:hypothetical protein